MAELHATRTELLARKNQITLAEQGRDLLKEKRDALVIEFMAIMDRVLEGSRQLQIAAENARQALALANAVDGTVTIRSAAMAARSRLEIEMSGTYVMGVPCPTIERRSVHRTALTRGYSITGVSSRVDEAAEAFEDELEVIIRLAGIETKLRRLGTEIQKTRRRVNALENVILPDLRQQVDYIEMVLEERAREDLFRLKKVKKALTRHARGRMSGVEGHAT
ncbi:MAG: V-type ATP synthase subunit D [Bacillota bacterium]|nr:V-type ATP synthase subunit D [Bacillota bacterium]